MTGSLHHTTNTVGTINRKTGQFILRMNKTYRPIFLFLNQIQSATVSTNPNTSVMILINAWYFIVTDGIRIRRIIHIMIYLIMIRTIPRNKPEQSVFLTAKPYCLRLILQHDIDSTFCKNCFRLSQFPIRRQITQQVFLWIHNTYNPFLCCNP